MRRVLALSLGVCGCGPMAPVPDREMTQVAVRVVWDDVYLMPRDQPPPAWLWWHPIGCLDAECHDGLFRPGLSRQDETIDVVWYGTKVAHTRLAHELFHALLWRTLGDLDGAHRNPAWGVEVPRAERALDGLDY